MIDDMSIPKGPANPQEIGSLPPWHRDRQRAFERARHAATMLCRSQDRNGVEPATVERYRWLVVAMSSACGTQGGIAIAELARRGYILDALWAPHPSSRLRSIGSPGVVWLARGLPRRGALRWSAMEQQVLRIDIATLPRLEFVTGHETIRIKSELRREGYDLG